MPVTHMTHVGKHEPKVDVHDMPIAIKQDVAVMAILDLQQVRRDRVSSKRLGKVELRPCELGRTGVSVCLWVWEDPRQQDSRVVTLSQLLKTCGDDINIDSATYVLEVVHNRDMS
jgi:hypothetical protein